jgi:hypothetical protein
VGEIAMRKKHKDVKKLVAAGDKSARPGGFWDRSESKPGVLSVRHSSSRMARSLAFLRRIVGLGSKSD